MHRQSLVDYGKPLQATEAPTPKPQGSEVLLRVSHCGVCHSDIHLQDGYFDLGGGQKLDVRGNRPLPFTLGHEIAGTVEAAGPDAQGVTPRASATPPTPGSAAASAGCARAATSTCAMRRACSASPSTAATPRTCWCRIRAICSTWRASRPQIAGALMCSGLTGYGAIKKALPYLRAGPLLIVGLGGVGMMGLQFARALTDKPIFVADIDKAKREAALKLGAAEAFDPADAGARKAIVKASGGGVGAAVDFAGSDKSLAFAHGPVAKGGAAIVVGLIGGSFTHAGADVPPARAHHHGQLRRLARRGARDAGPRQGRQGGADPRRAAAAGARQRLARRSARRQDRRPRGGHALSRGVSWAQPESELEFA